LFIESESEDVMSRIDFAETSLDELWSLHEQICDVLSTRINAEKRELENRLAQLNRQQNDRRSVLPKGKPSENAARKQYPRVLPKYRNPIMPEETWSGRGKQPRWLVSALKAGGNIEDFKISPALPDKIAAIR
jgi:DNA-binding protein H-NS